MRVENKRVFICDLPETTTKEELENSFGKYGEIASIEIKERKELGPKNKSLFFAYVNLLTDDQGINTCFRELSNKQWHGEYIQLQIAKESFLERLKREREEQQSNNKDKGVLASPVKKDIQIPKAYPKAVTPKPNKIALNSSKNVQSLSESDTDSSDLSEIETKSDLKLEKKKPIEEKLDIVIKNNKDKRVDVNCLKIPSVGKEPIITISREKKQPKQNDSEANIKRLQSLKDMKKGYEVQKSAIRNALSSVDKRPNNKIVFDDFEENLLTKPLTNGTKKASLFNDEMSDAESDFEGNFKVKEQFQGKSGQKLLELQSRYKNDARFALDERFKDDNEIASEPMETEEENLEAEKNNQLQILENVLGKQIRDPTKETKKSSEKKKTMLRFDPSQPEHSNFEIAPPEPEPKKKRKEKREAIQLEIEQPEVSKEVFYKVSDHLKETFEEKQQFSLLNMFGKAAEEDDDSQEAEVEKEIRRDPMLKSQNPFKYDSSDDEDETENIPHKSEVESVPDTNVGQKPVRASQTVFWTEPFFFKNDDFRLQEGLDFIEKVRAENKEFLGIRKELKGIVKAKIRNNERKNKMFKKKLGGSKRRKHIRIKKALKR